MNTQALQCITNPAPLPRGSSGERIHLTQAKAKTTAALIAEIREQKRRADPDANVRSWLDTISGVRG